MPTLYQGDSKTYRLTITDSAGNPPAGGTLAWTILHVVKADDDDATELIRKTSDDPLEVEPVPPPQNPDENKWFVYYVPTDTATLEPGSYVRFTKIITAGNEVHTILRDTLDILPKGVG